MTQTGMTFFVQLKGQEKADLTADGKMVKFSLETKHAAYYADKVTTLPVFLVLLVKFGIVGTRSITQRRLYLWVGIYILTAVITPDGGPIADVALFAPIILLLEGSLFIARRYEKKGPLREEEREPAFAPCRFCGAPFEPANTFCLRCGKSRL